MAHYSQDCWDAEVETSYGWIEIAGHADRACYDLSRHSKVTKKEMVAARPLKEQTVVKFIQILPNKKEIGMNFKAHSKAINEHIEGLTEEEKFKAFAQFQETEAFQFTLEKSGESITLSKQFIEFQQLEKTVMEEKYIPSVIEPSFGIGRIIYCIFEHCFKIRGEDKQRTFFSFPPLIAPLKCSILPLIDRDELNTVVNSLSK